MQKIGYVLCIYKNLSFYRNRTTKGKRKRNKKLRFSPNLEPDEYHTNRDGDFLSTSSRKLKSEGDTPDCISEELAQMIADSVITEMQEKSKKQNQNSMPKMYLLKARMILLKCQIDVGSMKKLWLILNESSMS